MQRTTPVVLNLIIINVLLFAAQNLVSNVDITEWGALHYFKSSEFKPHQLITHMFLHGSISHLFFNMFSLFMFGTMLENYISSKRFFVGYMICGLGAGLLTQLTIPYSAEMFAKSTQGIAAASEYRISMAEVVLAYKNEYSMIGASGAIMGVMAAFAYLFPNTEMFIMFIPIPVKAKYVIPVFVLIDLFGGINPRPGDNVGHFAHLGGAIVGFLLVYYWNKTNRKTFY